MGVHHTDSQESKPYSRIDASGTDPNRYSNSYLKKETPYYNRSAGDNESKSYIPKIKANIGTVERIAMVVAGSYILYKALSHAKKNIPQSIAGGTMLLRGASGYCPAYAAMGKSIKTAKSSNVNIRTSMIINSPVSEVYAYWRNLENLPNFMGHLDSVVETDRITSEWKATGPGGIGSLSWKAQILMDEPNRMLSWQSLPDSTVHNAGKVLFQDNGNGSTELDVVISYHAPLGQAGEAAAKLLNPLFKKIVKDDIMSFKRFMETGSAKKS